MNKKASSTPEMLIWIVIGLVVLGALVFGVRAVIKNTTDADCIGGFLEKCEPEEEVLPPPRYQQGNTEFTFTINTLQSRTLNQGEDNIIKINNYDEYSCQAVILVNDAIYRESGDSIVDSGSCENNLIISFNSLKSLKDNAAKVELDLVVYKEGFNNMYYDPSSWLINKKFEVNIQ